MSPACSLSSPSSNILTRLLHDHLRNTLATKRLTSGEFLLLEPSQRVESGRNEQHDSGSDQARRVADQREPLDHAHSRVDSGAHVVCFEAADEAVEGFRGRADAQEERDFDEDEDESGDAVEQRERMVSGLALPKGPHSMDSGDVQANDTPQDDDVKVEDVGYAEREAEDYAEHAGPGEGVLTLGAWREDKWQVACAYHCPYIPVAISLAAGLHHKSTCPPNGCCARAAY